VWRSPSDAIFGAGVAVFAALLTAIISVYRIVKSQEQSRLALSLNAQETRKQPFFVKQFEVSLRATKMASTMATTKDELAFNAAENEFWLLYWGELAVVESSEVASAMVAFGDNLEQMRRPIQLPASELQDYSLSLADAVRNQTQSNWMVELPPLSALKSPVENHSGARRMTR
jgi:hypothetical protein